MKSIRLLLFFPIVLLQLAGCGTAISSVHSTVTGEKMAVVPYDPNCLWNLKMGRDYAAQGRYELAKEHYLMALAASNDPETRELASHELQSVDMMIKTQR
jgi:hypothetical protein